MVVVPVVLLEVVVEVVVPVPPSVGARPARTLKARHNIIQVE
jgi:hypothetical protein